MCYIVPVMFYDHYKIVNAILRCGSRLFLGFLVVTKVITVVETVIDGKVVQSSKTVDVDVDEIES